MQKDMRQEIESHKAYIVRRFAFDERMRESAVLSSSAKVSSRYMAAARGAHEGSYKPIRLRGGGYGASVSSINRFGRKEDRSTNQSLKSNDL